MNLHWLIHTMLKIFLSGLISKMCRTLSDVRLCSLHPCDLWLSFNVPRSGLSDRSWTLRFRLGEFCKQTPRTILLLRLILWWATYYVAFFSVGAWQAPLRFPVGHVAPRKWQCSGLSLSACLSSHHCLLWFCVLPAVSTGTFWPLVLFRP